MPRRFLAGVLLLVITSPAWSQPSFHAVRSTHGPLGPEWTDSEFTPADPVCLHFEVCGLQSNRHGYFDMTLESTVRHPDGEVASRSVIRSTGELWLEGFSVPGFFLLPSAPTAVAGVWVVELTATDNVVKNSTECRRVWTCTSETRTRKEEFLFHHGHGTPRPALLYPSAPEASLWQMLSFAVTSTDIIGDTWWEKRTPWFSDFSFCPGRTYQGLPRIAWPLGGWHQVPLLAVLGHDVQVPSGMSPLSRFLARDGQETEVNYPQVIWE